MNPGRPRTSEAAACTECGGPYWARGLCRNHYEQAKRRPDFARTPHHSEETRQEARRLYLGGMGRRAVAATLGLSHGTVSSMIRSGAWKRKLAQKGGDR